MSTVQIPIMRAPISLPCEVPVLPGSPDTDAPGNQRTETCSTDAWWMVGKAPICHQHLVGVMGAEEVASIVDELGVAAPNDSELLPWAERHRYEQNPARLTEGHPHRVAWEAAQGGGEAS